MLIEQEKSGGDASEATLSEIRDLLEQQIEFNETIWVDNTGTYYVRRVAYDEGTQTYTIVAQLPDGTPYSPTAPVEPASSGNDRELSSQEFLAIANGTGFSTGDTLVRTNVIDTLSATVIATIWFNQTTGSSISAPTITDVEPSGLTRDILVSLGDQTDAAYTTGSGSMISILKGIFGRVLFSRNTGTSDANTIRSTASSDSPEVVSLGGIADVAYTTGSGSVISILKGLFGKFGTLGQKNMTGSAPVVIASDQSTLPISAVSLPLPSGAATEATLAGIEALSSVIATETGEINTNTGTVADAAYTSGDGSIISILKGIFGRLSKDPIAPAATQSTANFYVAAAVTQDQNSSATATTPSTGGRWIQAINNSGVICDVTVGGTAGGTDGTTLVTLIAGASISQPLAIAASAVLRIKPRSAALTSSDVVSVVVT